MYHMSELVINRHGGNKAKWSKKDKIEALLMLQRNDFNLTQTATELNIRKQTLQYWHKEYGESVYGTAKEQKKERAKAKLAVTKQELEIARTELEIINAARQIQLNDGDLINSIYLVKFTLMDRILHLAKSSSNLRDIAYTLEIIQKAEQNMAGDKELQNQFILKKNNFMEMVKKTYPNLKVEDAECEIVNTDKD
jgi:transposase-like protein